VLFLPVEFIETTTMEYTIAITPLDDGWFMGQCEQIPEAITQGKGIDDLMFMMKDAIELCLEYKRDEYRRLNNSHTTIMPLTLRHEKKCITKTPQRKRVYA